MDAKGGGEVDAHVFEEVGASNVPLQEGALYLELGDALDDLLLA
jgi:hypothetical protein